MFDDPLSERDVEDVLAGRQPSDRSDCGETAEWIARLRSASRSVPPPPINLRLRAQLYRHGVPAIAPPPVSDEAMVPVGSDAITPDEGRSPAAPGYSRRRWRIAGVAAVGLMVVGAVTAVLFGSSPPTSDMDGRSQVVWERPDVDDTRWDDADDLDASTVPPPKEPPPRAEPAPTTTDVSDEQESDADDRGNFAGLMPLPADPEGMWSAWLEDYCSSIEKPSEEDRSRRRQGGGDGRSDVGPVWSELCEAEFAR